MADGYKIKTEPACGIADDIGITVQLFLDDEISSLPKMGETSDYDLESAFVETKRNRLQSLRPILISMTICTLLAIAFVLVLMKIALYRNNNIQVQVRDFDDLNLQNLFTQVQETQAKLEEAENRRSTLVRNRDGLLQQAEAERSVQLQMLNSMNLTSYQYKQRSRGIEIACEQLKLKAQEIEGLIAECDANIDKYRKTLASYNSAQVEQAARIKGETILQELERKKIYEQYEERLETLRSNMVNSLQSDLEHQKNLVQYILQLYDPSASNFLQASQVADKALEEYRGEYLTYRAAVSPQASELFRSTLERQADFYKEFSILQSAFAEMPQQNAQPRFVQAMRAVAAKAGNDLTEAAVSEVNTLISDKNKLQQEKAAFEELLDAVCGVSSESAEDDMDGIISSVSKNGTSAVVHLSSVASQRFAKSAGKSYPALILDKITRKPVLVGTLTVSAGDITFTKTGLPEQNTNTDDANPAEDSAPVGTMAAGDFLKL